MNPQQREAVQAVDGPVLILAGAGSGKTRVITHRICYLIAACGVAPDSILAVTFTNKAAAEMAERVERLLGHNTLARPQLSTFHSFCVRVLRRDIESLRTNGIGLTRNFAIYDENDQQAVVKQALKRLGIDDKQLKPRVVLGKISWAKNHMIDPQEYYLGSSNPQDERIAHLYEQYRKELFRANALDFDDLLLETVRLLKVATDVRERYNRRYRYLLIDEYQDTNRPQYELMKLLSGPARNVCVVGDEDQSIYSWRGADIKNILEFEKDFPDVRIIRLEQNYRSTQIILEAASAVVANNTLRKGKQLWTSREGGSLIGIYVAPDGENEALFVADRIQRFLAEQPEHRCAVLYRTNAQSRLMEEALRRYGIQYTMAGGFSFYDRAEIKDLLSYLKLVINPDDSIALNRIINTPARGIGKTTLETIERIALETGSSTWSAIDHVIEKNLLPQRALTALAGFRRLIEDARAMLAAGFDQHLSADVASEEIFSAAIPDANTNFDTSFDFGADTKTSEPAELNPEQETQFRQSGGRATLPELIRFLIERSGYIRALEAEATPEAISRIENLRELANAAQDAEERGESLAEFLDHASLAGDADQINSDARVTLMTLHTAKGLEFPLVFLVGMEEGLFPHSRTFSEPDQLEEERRLCYVGMTRAMDTLILTRARYRRRYGNDMPESAIPSRFFDEVPAHLTQDLGSPEGYSSGHSNSSGYSNADHHYSYEDEDQSAQSAQSFPSANPYPAARKKYGPGTRNSGESISNIAQFFSGRGTSGSNASRLPRFPKSDAALSSATNSSGLRNGQRVRHPKYGEGIVFRREGDGDDARLTVQFTHHGMKKLVEKFAQLERI
jgi:DNA helicase-2/ATP-dependent DNA helicase PcrA